MPASHRHRGNVNDICLFSHRAMDLGSEFESQTGQHTLTICINGQNIDLVGQFVYLRSIVSVERYVTRRINSAGYTFAALFKIVQSILTLFCAYIFCVSLYVDSTATCHRGTLG